VGKGALRAVPTIEKVAGTLRFAYPTALTRNEEQMKTAAGIDADGCSHSTHATPLTSGT
jgi:hypothetical protein